MIGFGPDFGKSPFDTTGADGGAAQGDETQFPGGVIISRKLSRIQRRQIRWLWKHRIARGKLSLIAGHPGLGKSQAALSIAATVTTAGLWPDGSQAQLGNVIILTAEDDPEDTVEPRLAAAGGNPDRVEIVEMIQQEDPNTFAMTVRGFSLKTDLAGLEALIQRLGDVALIIIDPVTAYLGDEVDSHKMADVRAILAPVRTLARKYDVAVLAVTHLRKNSDGDAVLLVTGSLAFVAAARAVFFVMRDLTDKARRLFLTAKNNLGIDTNGFAYAIRGVILEDGTPTSQVVWEPGFIEGTADDELNRRRAAKHDTARETEMKFLKELLAGGPVETEKVKLAVKAAGFAWGTVRRAFKDLGGIASKPYEDDAPWQWRLP